MASEINLHPDLSPLMCEGGMFDVMPSSMDLNIGRYCRFINPGANGNGDIHYYRHRVVTVQKLHDGTIAYRVVADDPKFPIADTFGRPARPNEISFI